MRAAEAFNDQPTAGFPRFSLVLMVTHACNLRCSYCYVSQRLKGTMHEDTGRAAIDRAVASIQPGGTLELGFFGGEPLLQAALIHRLMAHGRSCADAAHVALSAGLTTNGTVVSSEAWQLLNRPDLTVAISFDGLPQIHDRYRRFADGHRTSWSVRATMRRIRAAGKDFRVVMVVRPDTVQRFPEGVMYLWNLGVRRVDPSLDLRAHWHPEDMDKLDEALHRCADVWAGRLPELSISWLDEKVARILDLIHTDTAACGSGSGEVAVAPSGHLYPCERLIGDDSHDNALRLPGKADDGGGDFLSLPKPECRACKACARNRITPHCNATCHCADEARSGSISKPHLLLCRLNRACFREAARVLQSRRVSAAAQSRERNHDGSHPTAGQGIVRASA